VGIDPGIKGLHRLLPMMSTIGSHHQGNRVEGRELPLSSVGKLLLATQLPTVCLDVTLLATVVTLLVTGASSSPGLCDPLSWTPSNHLVSSCLNFSLL